MAKYWETETPTTITTNRNVIQYYHDAEKLSVARLPWTDASGKERQGKTVTLDIDAIHESGVDVLEATKEVFTAIADRIEQRLELLSLEDDPEDYSND